jgi:hypothetical protein
MKAPRTRFTRLVTVVAVSASFTAIGGSTARALDFQSFTAGHGRVLCNLLGREAPASQKQLLCWVPATGASVSLVPSGGRPRSRLRVTLRGMYQPAPPLGSGRRWVVNYAGSKLLLCAGKPTGVACNNANGHGFLLDARGIATY